MYVGLVRTVAHPCPWHTLHHTDSTRHDTRDARDPHTTHAHYRISLMRYESNVDGDRRDVTPGLLLLGVCAESGVRGEHL